MGEQKEKGEDYRHAARDVVIAIGEGEEPRSDDLEIVISHLEDELDSRFAALTVSDRNDVVGDTLMALVGAVGSGRVDLDRSPGGYIWRIAERRALDRLRRPAELPLLDDAVPDFSVEDDEIASRLDERARARQTYQAIDLARREGNHAMNKTVTAALHRLAGGQRSIGVRDLAAELGVSHDTVARHIRLFRHYVERVLAAESAG